MQDTGPPTNPGDIVVIGQRRSSPNDPFPVREPPPTGPVDPDVPSIEEDTSDPCLNPDTAREWNADAAAAEALRRMLDFALREFGEDHLANREFGTMLCEMNGSIVIGEIVAGDPLIGPDGRPTGNTPNVRIDRVVVRQALLQLA